MRKLLALLLLTGFATPLFAGSPVPGPCRPQPVQADDEEEPREETVDSWLAAGEAALDTGRYKSAKADFKKVLKEQPAHQAAARGLAAAQAAEGDYKQAIKTLEAGMAAAGDAVQRTTRVHLARLHLLLGAAEAAQPLVDALLKADAADLDGLLLKAHLELHAGKLDEGAKTLEALRQAVLARRNTDMRFDKAKGRQPELADLWATAGEGYFLQNKLHEANDCWGNAIQCDEYHLRTNAWMARLYLEQNHDSSSLVNYVAPTLKHNEFAADVHYWAARVHFFRWRGSEGMKSLERCLKINPDHPEALAFRAARNISNDQYEEGRKDYERALKLNPRSMEALGAKALHGRTLGLEDVYAEAEKAVLSFNARPARFYEIVADGLSERFRYHEALPLYAKTLELNPRHWTAWRGQGMAAMNKGDDVLGKKSLSTALDNDPLRNNLQTVNLLTLLDSYKNFERVESADGRWRLLVHKSEAAVMKDLYFEHLNASYDSMEKKYSFTPRLPLTIEAFNRHEDFEVRTVGITGLPALGACFGQLITLDSPSARPPGSYNWASTVRHEMDHVFQIQISNGQVPRWLAEGLSVYEEKLARPEWERHMEDQLFHHYHQDDIPPVKRFNEWFRDGSKVLFAYYLGNVMLEFIDKKLGGLSAVRQMLEMFGQKRTPEEVFRACLKIEPEQFDRRFRDYVANERIKHLRMVPRISQDRIDELLDKAQAGEATRPELVELGMGYAQGGSRIDADTWLGMAGQKGAGEALGQEGAWFHYAKALLARGNENMKAAERQKLALQHIHTALGRGLEDFNTYLLLAQIAQQNRDMEEMQRWLERARESFPESATPYQALYQLYQGMQQRENAIATAEAWMRVDESELGVRMWLLENVYKPGANWARMEDMAWQALCISPLDPAVHRHRAFALRKLKRFEEAVRHYQYIRRMAAGTPDEALATDVEALLDIAATWMQADQKDKARQALDEARKLDPDNPRIKTIEDALDPKEKEEDF